MAQPTASLILRLQGPDGTPVPQAVVKLENRATGFSRSLLTDDEGACTLAEIPPQTYRLTVEAPSFRSLVQSVALRSGVPFTMDLAMELAAVNTSVTVTASETADLVDTEATGTRTALTRTAIDKVPAPPGNRGLEAYLLTFPGFAMNANGAIHPRGAHNQMTYVIDGMPINDQLTGAFATALDPNLVESLELYTGDVPAEFGAKVSGVASVSTRSAVGSGRRLFGSLQAGASSFDTRQEVVQAGGEKGRFAWFSSLFAVQTHRFLDQVSRDNLHNGGNSQRGYARVDYQAGERDWLHFHVMAGRSGFELANLRSQHAAGMDQRQLMHDLALWARWTRVLSPASTFESTLAWRPTIARLIPSPGDTPVTASQSRHLTTLTSANRYNRVAGRHNLRAGLDLQYFPVSENFFMAVTSPSFTALPQGEWFRFSARRSGTLASAFAQDAIKWGRLVLSLGTRYDYYRFLVRGNQVQPRVGAAFHLKETGTVFRASYNRNYQTPPNENLLLSSSGSAEPLRAQRENVYEMGIQQSLGGRASLNASFYHKDSRDQQDNNNFFDTGVIFPVTLASIRVNGAEGRITLPSFHGITATLSATHARAISTPPFTGGLFLGQDISALTGGPFVIDHDQKLSLQTTVHYTLNRNWWVGSSVRYDSGLVSAARDPRQVAADPDYADLLPYVDLLSDPPRVRPRTITDVSFGYRQERWDVQLQVGNLFDSTALYNFQSVFVGTRLVSPRSVGVKARWNW